MQSLIDHCGSLYLLLGSLVFPSQELKQVTSISKSKHGLPCFVVFLSCSAKLSGSFSKQYYNSQFVIESELDILHAKSLEGQGALFVL